jgi:hypothetical protein
VAKPILMFRIDVGFDPDRGYGAALYDVHAEKMKGIKASNVRQLMRLVGQEICECEQQKRRFPLEHEREPSRIITPNGYQA